MKTTLIKLFALTFASCQLFFAQANADFNDDFKKMMDSSFKSKGIVKTSALKQDYTQDACSVPNSLNDEKDKKLRQKIEKENYDSIVYPADGNYFGDYKTGEKIAQSGKGLTWKDNEKTVNGGGCYNCHQLSHKEISFGTIGPSLLNYGKLRGNSEAIVKYTWGKLYNAKAFNACSDMPRNGYGKILSEDDLRHVMSLLLDPKSPVNSN